MYNQQASPRLYRVKFVSSGQAAWGIRNAIGAPRIEECQIEVTGTGTSSSITYGIVFSNGSGLPAGRSSILRSHIHAGTGHSNYGVYMSSGQVVTEIRDSTIEATGGSVTVGLYADGEGWDGNDSLAIRDTEISSFGAISNSYGILFEEGATIYLTLANSKAWGTPGVEQLRRDPSRRQLGSSTSRARRPRLDPGRGRPRQPLHRVEPRWLRRGTTAATGWLGCAGVRDEGAVFYANTARSHRTATQEVRLRSRPPGHTARFR
jgi:hypothetical protein